MTTTPPPPNPWATPPPQDGTPPPPSATSSDPLSALIPYKNANALYIAGPGTEAQPVQRVNDLLLVGKRRVVHENGAAAHRGRSRCGGLGRGGPPRGGRLLRSRRLGRAFPKMPAAADEYGTRERDACRGGKKRNGQHSPPGKVVHGAQNLSCKGNE